MASSPFAFNLSELEVIARVYGAASAALVAREPIDSAEKEAARRKNLRERLLTLAQPGSVEFDSLYEEVMSTYDAPTPPVLGKKSGGKPPSN